MAQSRKPETARQAYIRLLEAGDSAERVSLGSERDKGLMGELIDEDYVRGKVVRERTGRLVSVIPLGITTPGRLFLDRMRKQEREEAWRGRLKTFGIPILTGIVCTALGTAFSDLILRFLGAK